MTEQHEDPGLGLHEEEEPLKRFKRHKPLSQSASCSPLPNTGSSGSASASVPETFFAQAFRQYNSKTYNLDVAPSQLKTLVQERYSRVTCFACSTGEMPTRYCYLTEGEEVLLDNYYPIALYTDEFMLVEDTVPSSYKDTWVNLSLYAKAKLYFYLKSMSELGTRVVFDSKISSWINKTSKHSNSAYQQEIRSYGFVENENVDIFSLLACGRSQEDIIKELVTVFEDVFPLEHLTDLWQTALLGNVPQGETLRAVEKTLESMMGLARGLGCLLPRTTMRNFTSPPKCDALPASHTGSSDRENRSQSTCSSPFNSLQSIQGDWNKAKRQKVDPEAFKKQKSWSKHAGVYSDLAVISEDKCSSQAKYLFLIDVYCHNSTDKTVEYSLNKFIKEVVHVLQAQNEVFGIFFTSTFFRLYRAKRSTDHDVSISSKTYNLRPLKDRFVYFPVAVFQKFWMDVFTCFVYGMAEIEI